jgi:hypothetical protein
MDRPAPATPRQRRYKRNALDRRLKIFDTDSGELLHGRCTEISPGGLGAVIAGKLGLGDPVELELTLGAAGDLFRVRAIVRSASGFHYGFEFLEPSHALRHAIMTAVGEKSGDKQ